MNVGELKKILENIDNESKVLVITDDLDVECAYYGEADEYRMNRVDNGKVPFCISTHK